MFQINWKLKALLYKVFEVFKLNKTLYFVQRYITGRAKIQFTTLDPHWKRHAVSIQEKNCKSILEIGAGKSLEQNIFFSYYFDNSKFQRVIDINNMINLELCNEASHRIAKLLDKDFKGKIKNIRDLKSNYNIYYEAPCKLEDIKVEKFDICTSTTSLEHFSLDDLNLFLNQIKFVLKKNGFVSSIIDYSDHYSHTDKNINPLNFLTFSEKNWKKYNNNYLFQNRLRHNDYRNLFKNLDFIIEKEHRGTMHNKIPGISKEFDQANDETFLGWGYYLISIR